MARNTFTPDQRARFTAAVIKLKACLSNAACNVVFPLPLLVEDAAARTITLANAVKFDFSTSPCTITPLNELGAQVIADNPLKNADYPQQLITPYLYAGVDKLFSEQINGIASQDPDPTWMRERMVHQCMRTSGVANQKRFYAFFCARQRKRGYR